MLIPLLALGSSIMAFLSGLFFGMKRIKAAVDDEKRKFIKQGTTVTPISNFSAFYAQLDEETSKIEIQFEESTYSLKDIREELERSLAPETTERIIRKIQKRKQ